VKRIAPVVAAFSVGGGMAVATFMEVPQAVFHLARPLVVISLVSVVVGLATGLAGSASNVVAVTVMAWLMRPQSSVAVFAALLLAAVIAWRLGSGRLPDIQTPVAIASGVFLVVGLVPMVPTLSAPIPDRVDAPELPTFLILLDGYPRADSLANLGVDISAFIRQLEDRGFDHYPTATSHHSSTWQTLTLMLTGRSPAIEDTFANRLAARQSWTLPTGFVTVAPPIGSVTIPHIPVLNPGGPTVLEAAILQSSVLGLWTAQHVMDGYRFQLDRAIEVLASTEETHVFAHLLAPHVPFLYDEVEPTPAPSCWPRCNLFLQEVSDWRAGMDGYLSWLNPKIVETVDAILANHPAAEIVLFADHGGRYDDDVEERHRVFLAARTPTRPGLFSDAPHPGSLLSSLSG